MTQPKSDNARESISGQPYVNKGALPHAGLGSSDTRPAPRRDEEEK